MAFLVSPGVEVKEIDLSNFIPALSTSVGAYAGYFNWGPVGQRVLISTEAELGAVFGKPNYRIYGQDPTEISFFTAAGFLKYSNALRVVRAIPDNANNAIIKQEGTPAPEVLDQISTLDELEQAGNSNQIYGRYPGSLANGLEIYFIDNDLFERNEALLDSNPNDVPLIPTEINAVLTHIPDTTVWAKRTIDPLNELSDTDETLVKDEVHIVVVDGEGKFTGDIGAILEVHSGLSYAENSKNQFGESNYFVTNVNTRSNYIWIGPLSNQTNQELTKDTVAATFASYTPFGENGPWGDYDVESPVDEHKITLDHGFVGDYVDEFDAYDAGPILDALDLYEDPTQVDINLLFAQNFYESAETLYRDTATAVVDQKILTITDKRRDLVGFISAPVSLNDESTDQNKLDALITKFGTISSSSYVVFDSTPGYVYNRYYDGYTWIPLCGHMAGLCARTDDLTDPWFSPAGLNRGSLLGITKLAFSANQTQRDEIYTKRINPVISYPGQGIILFGDKTAQTKPSAFDRINVRRLFVTIEKAIANASKFQLFELNDEFTRSTFVNAVVPFLREVQSRRGIIDFRVVCDETNNTPEVIDTNRFVADIYIKPAKSINFITLNFIATRTGASFDEIVGR